MTAHTSRDTPGLMMPPPLFVLIAVVIAFVLDWATGLTFLTPLAFSVQSVVGFLIAVGGLWLTIAGAREFNRAGTNINPDDA